MSSSTCNKTLKIENDGVTTLKRHDNSKKHKERYRAVEIQMEGGRLKLSETAVTFGSVKNRARKVELLVALFIAKHNLAISLSDPLTNFLKTIDIDTRVQKELSCSSIKCTAILRNVTGRYCFE